MFSNHYYHRLSRKYVMLFGNLFDDITLVRYKGTVDQEIERIKVPISYAPKEKFIVRLQQDPDLAKSTQITLPRMSFERTSLTYDPSRQQLKSLKNPKMTGPNTADTQYMGVPYDMTFDLQIYARNIDDADQILEQIIPAFPPDYNVSTNLIPALGFVKDIPIILNNISPVIDYEGDFETVRNVVYTLSFTMKVWYFGPVSSRKLIRRVYANTYLDPSIKSGSIITMNLGSTSNAAPNSTFKLEDIVFQGTDINNATAAGIVIKYQRANNILQIGGAQGQFYTNRTIHAASTNAKYNLVSFSASPLKLVSIIIDPNPITANADSDFGYSITTKEYPNI